MKHQQTLRSVPGAKIAVMMIHGIVGTPDHFRTVLPLEDLVPAEYSLYNILLDGHGKQVEDFSHTSMDRWRRQTMDLFTHLAQSHEQIILVGHSLGCLLAMEIAWKKPEKIKSLFLLQVPLSVRVRPFAVANMLRYSFSLLDMSDPVQASTYRACSVPPTKRVWKYIAWLPRIWELFGQIRRVSGHLPDIHVPLIAWQSQKDGMVSNRSTRALQAMKCAQVHVLICSSHFFYEAEEIEMIRARFREVLI